MVPSDAMSPLATVSIAWASLHAYLALYYLLLFARRQTDREYLAFGAMSAALALYTIGSAFDADASDLAAGTRACIVQWSGATLAVGFYLDFIHRVLGLAGRRAVRFAYAWSLIGLAANLSGLFFDASTPEPSGTWGFAWAPAYHDPALLITGVLWAGVTLLFIAYAMVLLARHGRGNRDARVLMATTLLWLLGGGHDVFAQLTGMRTRLNSAPLCMPQPPRCAGRRRADSHLDRPAKRTQLLHLQSQCPALPEPYRPLAVGEALVHVDRTDAEWTARPFPSFSCRRRWAEPLLRRFWTHGYQVPALAQCPPALVPWIPLHHPGQLLQWKFWWPIGKTIERALSLPEQ